ncbi:MAG: PAS domain S-box protein [Planctomycetota bacterium]|nr:PAS domain S-box protein [Planctomycetota bacterium]
MNDQDKTRDQLIAENEALRRRVAEQEAQLANRQLRSEASGRKCAEEVLAEERTFLRQIIDTTPDIILVKDQEGRYVLGNRAAARFFGSTVQDMVGKTDCELLLHQDPATDALVIAEQISHNETDLRVIQNQQPLSVPDLPVTAANGHTHWFTAVKTPLIEQDGTCQQMLIAATDITERRQAEEALRDSEARLSFALEVSGAGAWDLDLVDHTAHRSLQHDRLFGYESRLPTWTYETFLEHVLPEDREAVDDLFRQAVDSQGDWRFECRIRRSDGQVRWIWAAGRHRSHQGDSPRRMTGIVQDITDRKRSEEALRESFEELWTIYHGMVDGILMADIETKCFVKANRAAGQMLGYSPEQFLSMSVRNIHPQEAVPKVLEAFQSLAEGRILQVDNLPVLRRDGSVFHADITANQIAYHGRHCLIGFFRDVTERRQAEAALAESEEKYRHLVETTDTGFLILDEQGRVADANAEYVRIVGHDTLQAILGRSVVEWTAPHDAKRNAEAVQRCLRQGKIRQFEVDYVRGDGTVTPIEVNASVVNTSQGKRVLSLCRDISERKRAEQAMHQTLAQLETIYGGMIEGLLITDIETKRFVRVNVSLCQMLGYSEEELLAASIKDIHPAEEVPNDLQRFQAAADGRVSINRDRPVLKKDGRIFFADITGHQISYDQRPCLLALFRDVTERKQAEEQLKAEQQALRRMVIANDYERRLTTYELHDGVAQQLLGAKMLFESQRPPKGRKSKAAEAHRDGMEALTQASAELRRVMNQLRTPVLDRFGLIEAIADVAAQLRLVPGAPEIEYQQDVQFERLEPTLENSLYRIAQEALTNACRHSQSEKVRVVLTQAGAEVTLEVQDWGLGFDKGTVQEDRFGLEGIRERSRLLDGEWSITSEPGQGTVVRVTFPVIEAAAPN